MLTHEGVFMRVEGVFICVVGVVMRVVGVVAYCTDNQRNVDC